jgi:hypothetical protein
MTRPPWEVADIIRRAGDKFIERYRGSLTWAQLKVLRAIERCRTAALGGLDLLYSGREAEGLEQLNAGLRIDADPAVSLLSAPGLHMLAIPGKRAAFSRRPRSRRVATTYARMRSPAFTRCWAKRTKHFAGLTKLSPIVAIAWSG